ncbi:hypothetical protein J2T57_002893 [Natronocella acetinitrilica]|uniref:Uncharacterized protein n=1 Tax=Natronocella acetinitrilica TaxID=414046 RepID=A0AAE3KD20_9GAMM|nr:DUF6166 domain-containing protein [Natronocella acetinitrilica]MCP1675738.1 hypothetical protein [Natronocella acetinitrilica]
MKVYRGERTIDGLAVTVDDQPLDPRYDLKEISLDGFEWTYEGPAPEQLSLALLADHFGNDEKALQHYLAFMREAVANFENEWEMTTEDIDAVLADISNTA